MTREEAIEVYNGLINTKIKEAFEFFVPELRESEDERIRKGLINIFDSALGQDFLQRKAGLDRDKVIAYLEKQKEHQNNSDAPNESSWSGMISSSDKDKNLDEIAQDYVDRVKEYNPEPTWDLMQTAVCYGYHIAEQKEQKPAEWSEGDEDMLNSCISSIEEAKENRYAYKETDGDTSYDYEIAWLKSLRPYKK